MYRLRRTALAHCRRKKAHRASLAFTLATSGVGFGALSLFLVVAAFSAMKADDLWWNLESPPKLLPAAGEYHSWAQPGSPMDCLLTSAKGHLSIDFGEQGLAYDSETTIDIHIGPTVTIGGVLLEDFNHNGRSSFFRRSGLPRSVGLSYLLDVVGAIQRPESDVQCQCWRCYTDHVATVEFDCDGVPQKRSYYETSCPRYWSGILRQPVYFRANGIADVGQSIIADLLMKKPTSTSAPTRADSSAPSANR